MSDSWEAADPARRMVIYSDGYNHPFAQSSAALAAIAGQAGIATRVTGSLDEALGLLVSGQGILAVNALRWSMTQYERYAADRPDWAGAITPAQMAALDQHVATGGSLLACHTAVICWDLEPRWPALLGGGWDWNRSSHPPFGSFAVQLTPAGRTISGGDGVFTVHDEAYHALDPVADCEVLATADLGAVTGAGPQPLVWRRRAGRGRVAVNALGHDGASLQVPGHAALVTGLLGWLTGRDA